MTLVRNPDYDPKTDSPAAREALPDEFGFTVDSSVDRPDQPRRGGPARRRDVASPPAAGDRAIRDGPGRSGKYLHLNPGDGTGYITMNLTQPPFDDIHVRRAMNWIIDKAALLQVNGGPLTGVIASHIVPDTMYDGQLAGYEPYAPRATAAASRRRRRAMKGSKYDLHHDGTCSARGCKTCCCSTDSGAVVPAHAPDDQRGRGEDRHHVPRLDDQQRLPDAADDRRRTSPIAIFAGWFKDYADPLTFFAPLFDGRTHHRRRGTSTSRSSASSRHRRRSSACTATIDAASRASTPARPVRRPRRPAATPLLRGARPRR